MAKCDQNPRGADRPPCQFWKRWGRRNTSFIRPPSLRRLWSSSTRQVLFWWFATSRRARFWKKRLARCCCCCCCLGKTRILEAFLKVWAVHWQRWGKAYVFWACLACLAAWSCWLLASLFGFAEGHGDFLGGQHFWITTWWFMAHLHRVGSWNPVALDVYQQSGRYISHTQVSNPASTTISQPVEFEQRFLEMIPRSHQYLGTTVRCPRIMRW